MRTDELEILGHLLIAAANNKNSRHPFTLDVEPIQGGVPSETFMQSWNQILKDCTRIAQNIPQVVRNIIGKKIQTRRDIEPAAQLPESCQSACVNYTQISQTPKEISQSTGVDIPSAIRPSPTAGTEKGSAEPISTTLSAKKPSAQTPAPVKRTSKQTKVPSPRFSRADLKSWANSPEQFLNLKEVDVNKSGVSNYIKALEDSQCLSVFRIRFALLQLYASRELWRPQRLKDFLAKLGTPRNTLYSWLKEGKNYYLLASHKGYEVLFSKLKPRSEFKYSKIPDPPQGKKRPIDDLVTDCDTGTDIGKRRTKEAKERDLLFTPEELELPEVYATDDTGDTDDTGEDRDLAKELLKAAAKSIATCLKRIHQEAGLLEVDGTKATGLTPLSNSEIERSAKRACQWHESHGRRGGSQDPRNAADPATNENPSSDVDRRLRESLTERDPGYDSNSSREFQGTSIDQNAPGLDEQGRTTNLHSPTSFEPSIKQQQGTRCHEVSSQGLQLQSSALSPDTPRSSQALVAFDQADMEASDNLTGAVVSMEHHNLQPGDTGPSPDTSSSLSDHGAIAKSALTCCETSPSALGQTPSTVGLPSIRSPGCNSSGHSKSMSGSAESTLSTLFLPICGKAPAPVGNSTFNAQATSYQDETSPESYWDMVDKFMCHDTRTTIWNVNGASDIPQPGSTYKK